MSNKKIIACIIIVFVVVCRFECQAANFTSYNLYVEDFQNTELEKHFANLFLKSMSDDVSGLNVYDISYERICDFLTEINLEDYESYILQCDGEIIELYLFTCSCDLVYSKTSYGRFCTLLYSYNGNVEKYRYIKIIPDKGFLTSECFVIDDEVNISFSDKVNDYYKFALPKVRDLLSTNCNVYDAVELLDNYTDSTNFYFNVEAVYGTNMNKYSAYEQSDTVKNHVYLTSCDIGFMTTDSNLSGSQKSRFNQTSLYIDYGLDNFMINNLNQYNLCIVYTLCCDGVMYNKSDSFALNSNKYNIVGTNIFNNGCPDGYTRKTFTRFNYENIDFKKLAVGNEKFGNGITVVPYLNQDISLTEQNEIGTDYTPSSIYNLTVSVQVVSKDGKYQSGIYKKTFDLLQGSANVVNDDITINSNPFLGDSNSSLDTGNSGFGNGSSSSSVNNSTFTNNPTFTNNNNITIEGDNINNEVNGYVDDNTSKDENEGFLDKFLGFFSILKNNKFVNVLRLIFGWLPDDVFTVITSAIGIVAGVAVIRIFRK